MKKIIDFLLIFGLAFLAVNIFMKPDIQKTDGSFLISSVQGNYKVPNVPVLRFVNNTQKDVFVDFCQDIIVRLNGDTIPFTYNDCNPEKIVSHSEREVSFQTKENIFEQSGVYTLDIAVGEKEYTTQLEMKNRGTVGQLFVYLFYAPIYNLMAYILTHVHYSLGFSIILLTLLVRILLIYPQHKMMVNQQKMQTVQPKIKAIQEKHKGNQAVLGQELLALYKKEGVNPVGSCGFLIIQMPILIVIYNVIRSVTDESNYFYIYEFLHSFKIGNIDPMFFSVDLLQSGGAVGIVLAVMVGGLQYVQVKLSLAKTSKVTEKGAVLTKKKDSNDLSSMMPDPEMMNKFMLYGMPGMVAAFTYFFFAGLGLYWGMTTLFMIVQQIIVSKKSKKSS